MMNEHPPNTSTDVLLTRMVDCARAGDTQAFTVLFEHYNRPICTYLTRLVGKNDLVHDLAQETFMQAWQHLPALRDTAKFRPWLYRIATNAVKSYWRRTKAIQSLSWQEEEECNTDKALIVEPPDEHVGKTELIKFVLAQLPPPERTCLVLQTEGFTLREIAELLEITEKHVSVRISRGKTRFRQIYHGLEGGRV
jgi:RNA polymerase sigma-70 factor (ECF subfamily)